MTASPTRRQPLDLLENLEKLHTTELGALRIQRNLALVTDDVIGLCKEMIVGSDKIVKKGKNYYVFSGDVVLTVNSYTLTVITARKSKFSPESR